MLQNAGGQIQESHREKEQVNCSLLLLEEEQEEEDPVENPINIKIECIRLELLHC